MLTSKNKNVNFSSSYAILDRGGSRATATSKMECFAIIVNGFQPLTIITKHCILDVAAALDPLLLTASFVSTRMLYLAREREEIFVSL